MTSENDFVGRLKKAFPRFRHGLGIGDDAAIVNVAGPIVLTADMLVEDLDFTTETVAVEYIMEKALVSNLSDLAAIGALPIAYLLSIALPARWLEQFDRMVAALSSVSRKYGVDLIGGDLSSGQHLVVSITAIGRLVVPNHPLLRSGAHPADRIFVSRPLGGSAAGLRLLQNGWSIDPRGTVQAPLDRTWSYAQRELAGSAITRHVAPVPELELAAKLAAIPSVSSCIDISDGLSTDLHHLCEASGVGAHIEWERVPVLPDLPTLGGQLGVNYVEAALHGGEEYSLLFTAPIREAEMSALLGRPVYAIGRITVDHGVVLERGGVDEPLQPGGHDHFRPS